jgi:hypothetical protein
MASGFPGSIDSFTNPLTTSALNSPSHAGQHQDLNDAVNKIETYMGLVKVIPTSVSAGNTLAANGTVTVGTAVSSVVISGAFSSLYSVYEIVLNNIDFSGTNDVRFDYDDAASNYNWSFMQMSYGSTTITGYRNQTQTSSVIGIGGTSNDTNLRLTVYNPNLAVRTTYSVHQNTDSYTTVGGGNQDATTQHTKFRISTSGTSMTGGTIRVYGYRN